jgi:hypothetical protein
MPSPPATRAASGVVTRPDPHQTRSASSLARTHHGSEQALAEPFQTVISSIERASAGIISCKAAASLLRTPSGRGRASRQRECSRLSPLPSAALRIASVRSFFLTGKDGPGDQPVRRFRVLGGGSGGKRAAAAILAGSPRNRTADKCARLYRASTLVALRIRPETYETAALPLSYVGASASIGDDFEQQLFGRSTSNGSTPGLAGTTPE